jgi:hypothetical protein
MLNRIVAAVVVWSGVGAAGHDVICSGQHISNEHNVSHVDANIPYCTHANMFTGGAWKISETNFENASYDRCPTVFRNLFGSPKEHARAYLGKGAFHQACFEAKNCQIM